MRQFYSPVLVLFCLMAWVGSTSFALYGLPWSQAPIGMRDSVLYSVAALTEKRFYDARGNKITFEKFDEEQKAAQEKGEEYKGEERWYAKGSAICIGNTATGSVFLVHPGGVTDADGNPDREMLADMRLTFGHTISDLQKGRKAPQKRYKQLEKSIIKNHPNYIPPNKRMKSDNRNYALGLLILPYKVDPPWRPMPVVMSKTGIVGGSPYLVFGHGNKFEELPEHKGVEALSRKEQDKSGGFLRWTPMEFKQAYANYATLSFKPMSKEALENLFQNAEPKKEDKSEQVAQAEQAEQTEKTEEPEEDYLGSYAMGPCMLGDSAAPVIINGSTLVKDIESGKLGSVRQVALLGVHRGSVGTCKPYEDLDKVSSTFYDLRDPLYQNWLIEQVPELARPLKEAHFPS